MNHLIVYRTTWVPKWINFAGTVPQMVRQLELERHSPLEPLCPTWAWVQTLKTRCFSCELFKILGTPPLAYESETVDNSCMVVHSPLAKPFFLSMVKESPQCFFSTRTPQGPYNASSSSSSFFLSQNEVADLILCSNLPSFCTCKRDCTRERKGMVFLFFFFLFVPR